MTFASLNLTSEFLDLPLCEMCPNTDFFLVRIFVYGPNAGNYGSEKNTVFGHFLRSLPVALLQTD